MSITLDWDWATRTGGNLSPQEYRHLVGVLLRDLPNAFAAMVRYRLGKRGTGRTDLVGLPVPDSTLARRAEEFAQQELSTHVLAHSYRTYFFGKVLAAHDGVAVDDEVVYLAALLHDLHLENPTPERCFAFTGAERAARLLAEWGADASTTENVAAAVCGHATPGADIVPSWLEDLQQRYPRHGLKQHLVAALHAEAKAVPRGRMHLANQAGLPLLIRLAPYPE
jgi:hypothetical protein